jgi:hypothetical protein
MTPTPATAKKPQDRKQSNQQRAEAMDTPTTFTFDGEEWTVVPNDATSLEFLAALEDNQIITALRVLLGREQAARLIKGRRVEDLEGFFDAMGEVTGSGNP